MVLEKTLESPWTARRSNLSILKEISPGISLEGMMLKLKLQYFGHLVRRVDSLEKTLILGGIGGRRRLLRVLWTARRSNQLIVKEINPEYSLEGLMLELQYFGHLMRRVDSLEKTLMLGGIGKGNGNPFQSI